MQPTDTDVHIDAALTDFSIAYVQDATNFVASQVMPIKPVEHKSDKYFIYNKNDWLRNDAVKKRAVGEGAPRSGFTLSKDNYDAEPYWTAVPLSELIYKNSDPSLRIDEAATKLVTQRMLIAREIIFADSYLSAGVWDTDVSGGTDFTYWNDYASDPQKDIDDGKALVLENTGQEPNTLVVAYKVHQALKRHPLIKDSVKYTSDQSISAEVIAKFFELDKYVVMKASYSPSNEGAAVPEYDFINATNALLMYQDGDPAILMPTAATIFSWTGLTGINDAGIAIDQYYDQEKKEDVVRGQFAFDMKVTGTDLGYFFSNAISASA